MEMTELGAWQTRLQPELDKPYFAALMQRVEEAYRTGTVYQPRQELFAAFRLTPPERVRVVILGQDPYHEPGQANGLSFSVAPGVRLPPSLRNIFEELRTDCGVAPRASGDLTPWAEQGVFLLNSSLSWQTFTDAVVAALAKLPQPVAFILWGAHAQKKAAIAQSSSYPRLVLQSPHPSPLSAYRGFFGSRPFSAVNEFLVQHGEAPVRW